MIRTRGGAGRDLRRRLLPIGVVLVIAAGAPLAAPAAAAAPTIGIASSVEQIRPTASAGGRPTSASLVAARNEFESFQIVVQGPATNVSVTGDLFGWGTTRFHRVDYYDVVEPSDGEGGSGRWADILIPERDMVYGEDRSAFPFPVPAGENRLVWVDVFVPPGTAAGNYSSSLTVTSPDGSVAVPVSLEVLGIDLPSTSSMENAFFVTVNQQEDRICRAHTTLDDCNNDPAKRRLLHSLYSRVALENRLTLSNGFALRPNHSPAVHPAAEWETAFEGPLIRGSSTFPAGASYRLAGARETTVVAYAYDDPDHCLQTCADQWEAEANEPGQVFADQVMWYGCDEANNNPAKWQACKDALALTNAGWPRPALATSTIAWYNAFGAPIGIPISTLVAEINLIQPKNGADTRPDYDTFLGQAGKALWLYSSCDSHGCAGDPFGSPDASRDGWPGYGIDAPANQHRAMSWMVERYRASGELYWSAIEALPGGWTTGGLMTAGANGDGTLFYPGTVARIGGLNDIPLESVRLKRIRDGREDFEYMQWLKANGGAADVAAVVAGIYPTADSAVPAKDGTGAGTLLAARAQLVDHIRARTGGQAPGGAGRIAFSSDRDGDLEIFTVNPDGTGDVQLTHDPASDRFPAWSPDGMRIAWTRGSDVWVMNANGSNPLNLTGDVAGAASKPAWSSNGATVVYVYDEPGLAGTNTDIHKMASNGTGKTGLVTYASGLISSFDPSVSPTDVVYFTQNGAAGGIYRINLSGTGFAQVTNNVDEVVDVSSDGTRLTFSRSNAGTAPYDVMLANLDGSGIVNLTAVAAGGAALSDYQSTFSPSGDRVAFVSFVGGDLELWTIGTDATGATPLTVNTYTEADPDWGPATPSSSVDFDGDGDTDRSVFRNGAWYAEGQATGFLGVAGDIPVPADYDGDGDTERAVYRNGAWFVDGQATAFLGVAGDVPVPADYDGDGDADRAVFRPSVGGWFVDGQATVFFGLSADIAVPGDYDGNGTAERAVFRPSVGGWYVNGQATVFQGLNGDIPVPGDYDGNGTVDRGIFRRAVGGWYVQGQATVFVGLNGDVPVPGDYDGNGAVDRGIWRPPVGGWYVQGQPTMFLGLNGDIPLPLPQAIYRAFF